MPTDILKLELERPFLLRPIDPDLVKMYAETPDELPPVLVFRVDDRLILSDGVHRTSAWELCGRTVFSAIVKDGTMLEAETAAGLANLRHGKPLSREERKIWAERMVKAHGNRVRAAAAIGVTEATIRRWTGSSTSTNVRKGSGAQMIRSAYLADAPSDIKEPLREAAKARNWTGPEIATAIEAVQDERIPEAMREAILTGDADPIRLVEGEPTYHQDTVARSLHDAKANAPGVIWGAFHAAARNLLQLPVEDLLDKEHAWLDQEWIDRDLDNLIAYLDRLRTGTDKGLRVVK